MARKQNNPFDNARQALLKTLKGSSKDAKRKASSLSRQWAKSRTQALKQAAKNRDKELTAQWRALRKLGFVNTTVKPAQKNLTAFRRKEIRKAFQTAQTQAALSRGQVVRPLERKVITTKIETRNRRGELVKTQTRQRIKYELEKHFKLVKTKNKPSQETGFVKTRKGYLFEVASQDERISISKKGKIKRDLRPAGGFVIESEGLSGEEILQLAEKITNGKFKIRKNQIMLVQHFGGSAVPPIPYYYDTLDFFVERLNRYERTMMATVFQSWLDSTEIRVATL